MKIAALIKKLEAIKAKQGNVEVMFDDGDGDSGPWAISAVKFSVAEEDEYPEDFDMPEGFKFALILN